MSSSDKNLSTYSGEIPDLSSKTISFVVSEWNEEITEALYEGAVETLVKHGISKSKIIRTNVPGSFELSLGAQWLAMRSDVDAVICLGCVIQGETKHFDFICQAVATGITEVNLKYNKPVVFGVLTTNNKEQAFDRAGGKHGNKGDEAAVTALKMLALQKID
jgi:6,7-dimethyl-8-ribityllumazine synthase